MKANHYQVKCIRQEHKKHEIERDRDCESAVWEQKMNTMPESTMRCLKCCIVY